MFPTNPTKIEIQISLEPETLSVVERIICALQAAVIVSANKQNPALLEKKTETSAPAPKKPAKPKAPKPEVVAPTPTVIPAPKPDAPEAPPVVVAKTDTIAAVANRDEMLLKIGTAGAQLAKQGKGTECRALFAKYGVNSLAEVPDERLGEFAADIRALGGDI